jgi:hypothetical protein
MCIEALPDHLKDPAAWKGTDHDTWWMRWFIPIKLKYLCFGPRDSHPWHQWREVPITLFSRKGAGDWRLENDRDEIYWNGKDRNLIPEDYYLSRIQYYTRWHIQIQWPFMIAFHFYFRTKDVMPYGERTNVDNKLFYCYFGAHRDADKVYWIPSAFVGLCWK